MRIKKGDTIHTAIKKVCETSTRAGSVVVLLQREFPDNTMNYLKLIDAKEIYGPKLADLFFKECNADVDAFLKKIVNG